MFGLDDWIAGLSGGGSIAVVVVVAALLGMRHATDPDHVAAVTTLVASGRGRATGAAARLGAWWGAGHALTLAVFGIPILLADRYLPEMLQRGAETAVAALIVFLAVRLLLRWRHGASRLRREGSGGHRHPVRSPAGAFGIGVVHGMGGSAGVGVLLLAAIPSRELAVAALLILALFTAVSMTIVTTGLGALLGARGATGIVAVALRSGVSAWRSGCGTRPRPGMWRPTRSDPRRRAGSRTRGWVRSAHRDGVRPLHACAERGARAPRRRARGEASPRPAPPRQARDRRHVRRTSTSAARSRSSGCVLSRTRATSAS